VTGNASGISKLDYLLPTCHICHPFHRPLHADTHVRYFGTLSENTGVCTVTDTEPATRHPGLRELMQKSKSADRPGWCSRGTAGTAQMRSLPWPTTS